MVGWAPDKSKEHSDEDLYIYSLLRDDALITLEFPAIGHFLVSS